jgi:hypothetical protein
MLQTMNRTMIVAAIVVTVLFPFVATGASTGGEIALSPTPAHPNATGTAFIDGRHVNIQARGLKPEAVYTVWFVNMKPTKHETGAGSPPFMFKTDLWGSANYSGALKESPFGKWSMVMVVLHPDGDPKNMQQMVGALSAKL